MVTALYDIVESLHSTLSTNPEVRKYLESEKCVYMGFPTDFNTFASRNSIAIELGENPFTSKSQDTIKKSEQSSGFYAMRFVVHVGYTENHKEKSFKEFLEFLNRVVNAIENSPQIEMNSYVKYKLPPEVEYDFTEQNRILYRMATIKLEYQGVFSLGQL